MHVIAKVWLCHNGYRAVNLRLRYYRFKSWQNGVWTIRTSDYSYPGLFVLWVDYSYLGLFVRWTIRTTDDSCYGLFAPFVEFFENINCYARRSKWNVTYATKCRPIDVMLALQSINVPCRNYMRINVFNQSYRCCLFDAVHASVHTLPLIVWADNFFRVVCSAVDVGAMLTTANYR